MAKKKSSSKKTLTILVVGLVGFIALALIAKQAGFINSGEQGVSVETATAKLKTIVQLVSASGKIQPEVEVVIRSDVSGEVIELAVKEGDYVRKGDLLVRLDPDIFQARIDELNASLLTQKARKEQGNASLIQAEADYNSKKSLYEKELVSELEYIQSKSNWESQKASLRAAEYTVQSAEAQLRKAEEELDQTVIRAPQDGTITGLAIEFGDRVLGNSQVAGTEMMRVSLLDKMEVLVEVNENDIVNVAVNDTARIEVDSYPERQFNGIITEIANSARVTGNGTNEQVTNYQVKVRIVTPHNLDQTGGILKEEPVSENPEEVFVASFKPGMSATVDIETQTAINVVSVPIQAVTVRDYAKDKKRRGDSDSTNVTLASDSESDDELFVKKEDIRKVVFLVREGVVERFEVETGISDNTHIQVLTGVDVGDEVVIGSYRVLSRTLKDGDTVKKDNQKTALATVQ